MAEAGGGDTITLRVRDQAGDEMFFKVFFRSCHPFSSFSTTSNPIDWPLTLLLSPGQERNQVPEDHRGLRTEEGHWTRIAALHARRGARAARRDSEDVGAGGE